MTPIIETMMNNNVENTKKTYALLDGVLGVTSTTYPKENIRVNEQNEQFFMSLNDEMSVIIAANYNPEYRVLINVVQSNNINNILATCAISINGNFEEKYTRFTDLENKRSVSDYFTTLSTINVEMIINLGLFGGEAQVDDEPTAEDVDVVNAEVTDDVNE